MNAEVDVKSVTSQPHYSHWLYKSMLHFAHKNKLKLNRLLIFLLGLLIRFHWGKMFFTLNMFENQWLKMCFFFLKKAFLASLVVQWLRICLLMQGTWVQALVWEDPTCRGATRPMSHKYWVCASGACAPQQERPRQWEARTPRWRVAPTCRN